MKRRGWEGTGEGSVDMSEMHKLAWETLSHLGLDVVRFWKCSGAPSRSNCVSAPNASSRSIEVRT